MLPDGFPGGAVADNLTYTSVLPTAPLVAGIVNVLLKPLFGANEISKPDGAVARTGAPRSFAAKANCPVFGLADAMPAHAEIVPATGPAVITGDIDEGFTVMVKDTGELLQPGPAEVKSPNDNAPITVLMEVVSWLVAVLMTLTTPF